MSPAAKKLAAFSPSGGHAPTVAMSGDCYELEVTERLDDFMRLAPEWTEFIARCEADHPFNTHAWLTTWWWSFGGDRPVTVIAVRHAGRLVCCLPLMTTPVNIYGLPFRGLSPWVNTHSFRSGMLCDTAHFAALDHITAYLASSGTWDILDMPYLPRCYQVHTVFKEAMRRHGLRYWSWPDMNSPRAEITGSWDDYLGSLSNNSRYQRRRKLKKLNAAPGARTEITVGTTADLEARLQDCWKVSGRTWKHEQGSSIAADPARMAFYEAVANLGWLVLGLVYLERRPIAFQYDLVYKGTLYNLKLGYDEEFADLSPGMVLRYSMLEWAHNNNIKIVDFLGEEQRCKIEFASGVMSHEYLRIYNNGRRSRLLYGYEVGLKPWLRRVKRNVSALLASRHQ